MEAVYTTHQFAFCLQKNIKRPPDYLKR